ncbi:MAG: YitT family protein [Lachnospiraceae bacterium]|nr:YitT family protein [Lachnospiraceae bacterium]
MKLTITKETIKTEGKRYLFAVLSAVIFALNIKTFVNAGGLFPGGFTGITLLIQKGFLKYASISLPYSIISYALNLFPIILGFRKIGVKFTSSSVVVIILTGFLADIIPSFPITYDVLLISIFGGLVNGLAVSVSLLGGTSSGGTDFIAIYASEKFGIDTWNYVLAFNALILIIAGAMFGWDAALYSIIFQFTSTQVVNVLHRTYKKITIFVITDYPDEVFRAISIKTHHSATLFTGKGCFKGEEKNMLYSVVSKTQVHDIVNEILQVDPKAFVNVLKTEYVEGNFFNYTDY